MPGIWMHSEACSGQLLDVSGHYAEAEAGLDPLEAAVPVLPEAPNGQGVLDPGIDPDTLEVRIRIQGPGEQERPPGSRDAAKAAMREAGGRKLSGKLLEAFSLLCQAGERFVSYMGGGPHQAVKAASSAEAAGEAAPDGKCGTEVRAEEREPR
jgi:hypothetical protein